VKKTQFPGFLFSQAEQKHQLGEVHENIKDLYLLAFLRKLLPKIIKIDSCIRPSYSKTK